MSAEVALRAASEALHKIGAACNARKLLDRDGHKLSQPMHDSLCRNLLDPDEILKIAADGFEACVRALAELGAKDVTILECSSFDIAHGDEDLIP